MNKYKKLISTYPELEKLSKETLDEVFRHRSSPDKKPKSRRGNPILAQIGDGAILTMERLAHESKFETAAELHNRVELYKTNRRLAEIGRAMKLEEYITAAYGVIFNDIVMATVVEALLGAVVRHSFSKGVSFWRKIRLLDMPSIDDWEITEKL